MTRHRLATMKRIVSALIAGCGLISALGCSLPGGSAAAREDSDPAAGAAMAERFEEIDQLIAEQKMQAALDLVGPLLDAARAAGDAEAWTRALVTAVQLRTALSGFETAVSFLRQEPWPEDERSQLVLDLFYAHSLILYRRAYGWDIGQRETVVSTDEVDVAAWTGEQIADQAAAAFARAWARREAWGDASLGALAPYVEQNDFPPRIRGTLRDTVSYLWADALVDSSLWSAAESNAVERLDLAALLAGDVGPPLHPLERLAAVLTDLERWHAAAKRPEAAFEAYRQRLEHLRVHSRGGAQTRAMLADLERRVEALGRRFPWWSMGMATVAELERDQGTPGHLVRAHTAAVAAAEAHPESVGGKRGYAMALEIAAPFFQLQAMAVDGLERRSLSLEHKNLEAVHLRAYRLDLDRVLAGTNGPWRLIDNRDIPGLVAGRQAAASWRLELPETTDFEIHRSHVVPPIDAHGLLLVVASDRADFDQERGAMQALVMQLSELVVTSRPRGSDRLAVSVLDGNSGAPRVGATVSLFAWRGGQPARRTHQAVTDEHGGAILPLPVRQPFVLLARDGDAFVLDHAAYRGAQPFGQRRPREPATLVYTDRAVYRPGQEILFKTVTYAPVADAVDGVDDAGDTGDGQEDRLPRRFAVRKAEKIEVALYDANGEVVSTQSLTSNDFGTTSGRFTIPAGRLLGAWRLQATWNGHAGVLVEAYKRPTFEVAIEDPQAPLRLGHEAEVSALATYYFGLPVSGGETTWRVVREPELWPWRGGESFGPFWPQPSAPEVVAAGAGRLDPDGRFVVRFTPIAGADDAPQGDLLRYRFRVEVVVTSSGGETRDAGRGFAVANVAVAASIEAGAGFFTAGTPVSLEVTRRDLDGQPRAGNGSWRLVGIDAPASTLLPAEVPVRQPPQAPEAQLTPGDLLPPRWQREGDPWQRVASWPDAGERAAGTVSHGADGLASVDLGSLPAGLHRLVYATEDRFGGRFETRYDFLVAGDGARVPLPALLLVEHDEAVPGDSVRIAAASGRPGLHLQLEVLRGARVLLRRSFEGGGAPHIVELPIAAADRGGLSVRLHTLADYQLIEVERRLSVPWMDRQLEISFATFRDRLTPGDDVTWRVEIKGEEGALAAGAAEVLASMYDRSLDLFAEHQLPRIAAVYPERPPSPPLSSVLGSADLVFHSGRRGSLPQPPQLRADRLRFFDAYPIGGPGRFGGPHGVMLERTMMASKAGVESAEVMADASGGDDMGVPASPAPPSPPPAAPGDGLRSDFGETAFWFPQLLSDRDGGVSFSFTAPDSVTAWTFWVEALTRDLRGGSASREVKTARQLLVRPQLPRFLRTGDDARLVVLIDNAGEQTLNGSLDLDIVDPVTGRSRAREFGLEGGAIAGRRFEVAAHSSLAVDIAVTAPERVGDAAVRAQVRAGDLADGELRALPVLPSRMHLVTSRFAAVTPQATRTLQLEGLRRDDASRSNELLVVEVDGQLLMSVLEAVPSLIDHPYPSITALIDRYVASGALGGLFADFPELAAAATKLAAARKSRLTPFDRDDPNRRMALIETPWLVAARGGEDSPWGLLQVLDPDVAAATRDLALAELVAAQRADGSFAWFPGGPASETTTLQVLWGFAKAMELGVEGVPADVVQRAFKYLADAWRRTGVQRDADCCHESAAHLAYVLSAYDDAGQMTGGVFTEDDRKVILDRAMAHWKETSPLVKVYLSLALARAGRLADSSLVLDSVLDSARTDPDLGTYWQPEARAWLFYNDDIVGHATVLRALTELRPSDPRRDGLIQWLMLNKQLNQWRSTRATAEVLYAVVHSLRAGDGLLASDAARVEVGSRRARFTFTPESYLANDDRLVIPGPEIEATMADVRVSNEGARTVFARATWHYATDEPPASGDGDLFTIARRYFHRRQTASGFELAPVEDGDSVRVGDQIEVQLEIAAGAPAEFVHARDPRPAGLEPEDQRSGYRFDRGVGWYEQVSDSGADLFFERLPAGTVTVRYRLRANVAGRFRAAPAIIQSVYAPSFAAHSAGGSLDIRPQAP